MIASPVTVHACDTAASLGAQAAALCVAELRDVLRSRERARVLLAAAPSQSATLRALATSGIDVTRIDFFHMDEYVGLPVSARQRFAGWLQRAFFDVLPSPAVFHAIDASGDPTRAARTYADVIGAQPFDVTLCGLGVNAHLAFNDPPADFADPLRVKVVTLDAASRRQQVDEGHFATLADVPTQAITATVPTLLSAGLVVCSVPGAAKRDAVARTLGSGPDPRIPGTALHTHPRAHLFVDAESFPDAASRSAAAPGTDGPLDPRPAARP